VASIMQIMPVTVVAPIMVPIGKLEVAGRRKTCNHDRLSLDMRTL